MSEEDVQNEDQETFTTSENQSQEDDYEVSESAQVSEQEEFDMKDSSFPDFSDSREEAAAAHKQNLDFILDIPLEITVELGRTTMIVNELLQLGQGSVVELSKMAGEPLEILINERLIARGEAVVVNEKFGIKITDIVTPMERIERLK
ncbi:MAG: flagellar motor switch protein FliN [Thermodesulfobacteriota bacterium]|nr:flagellar motor switch protein FliN [Thermodesulfobacteriota bacterium]